MGHADPQIEQALQPYWMPFTPNKEFKSEPKMFARAEGMYFYTPDGQKVIDASAGLLDKVPGTRGHAAQKMLFDAGLNLKSTGDALIMAPPSIAERSHIDEIIGKVRDVLSKL